MIYADTSFLVSAYADDVNTAKADAYLAGEKPRLPLVFFHWPEIARALYAYHAATAEKLWEDVRADFAGGRKLYPPHVDLDRVALRAVGMIRDKAARWPRLRAVDVMHVSAAVEVGARVFLSFDTASDQRILAHTQRLKVWPALTPEENSRLR